MVKVAITLGNEPSLSRVYEYDGNVDYNEKIADMVDSFTSLDE